MEPPEEIDERYRRTRGAKESEAPNDEEHAVTEIAKQKWQPGQPFGESVRDQNESSTSATRSKMKVKAGPFEDCNMTFGMESDQDKIIEEDNGGVCVEDNDGDSRDDEDDGEIIMEFKEETFWRYALMIRFDATVLTGNQKAKNTWRQVGELMNLDHRKLKGRCDYRLDKHWPNRNEPLNLVTVKDIPIRRKNGDNFLNNPGFI